MATTVSARRRHQHHGRIHEGSDGRRRQGDDRGEGADATAAPPAEDKKSMLMALGIPEEVADAAIASDGDSFKDGASRVSMFYSLKVNDDAKAEWKDHYLDYTKGAKASKGHVNVSHSYNEETKEVICSCASVPFLSGDFGKYH